MSINRKRGPTTGWLLSALPLLLSATELWAAPASPSLNYLEAFGRKSSATLPLLIGAIAISLAVVLIIGVLLLIAPFRGQRAGLNRQAIERTGPGINWIYIGVPVSTVVLFATAIWTMVVIADVRRPAHDPALTIEITGHQWWWEARYLDKDESRIFRTANEIHIPVGVPVSFQLKSADVIHSFWIPALAGKTDAIPGQTNVTWMQADKPGTYRGQCSEFCGAQHAHMGFYVVADEPNEFKRWYDRQLRLAPEIVVAAVPALTPVAVDGKSVFAAHCALCHAVRGTAAGGVLGPNLSHLMSRHSLAGAEIPNNPGYLSGWIINSQGIKPGCKMPEIGLSGPQLNAVRTYLATLD